MRRESSTVVALVGEADGELMAGLARSGNVSLVRAPAAEAGQPDGGEPATTRPGWEAGALALREAARRHSPYVVVAADPLAEMAAAWRAMWDVTSGQTGAAGFEEQAAQALGAWQDKRFELPDYYLAVAAAHTEGTGPDFYLGPLRAARPRRVAVAGVTGGASQAARVLDTLRSLEHGPWWPALGELIDVARHFYAGGLAETQPANARAAARPFLSGRPSGVDLAAGPCGLVYAGTVNSRAPGRTAGFWCMSDTGWEMLPTAAQIDRSRDDEGPRSSDRSRGGRDPGYCHLTSGR